MKHRQLHAIAHNYAESLACGLGFVVGYCPTNIDAEIAASESRVIEIDFLSGSVLTGNPSGNLRNAIVVYRDAFPEFCGKHNADISDFQSFTVRYTAGMQGVEFVVTIEDSQGRRSSVEYAGRPGRRKKRLDGLGRIRPTVI